MTSDQLLLQKRRLLDYYEAELRALRQLGREFAEVHPKAAGKLQLHMGADCDPHVERLLEGVAFLSGRVRAKLDDEFPELTDALLGILYPHLVTPIPSMTILQFQPQPGASDLVMGMPVPIQTEANTLPVDGIPVRYQTRYPVTLWPLELSQATASAPPFSMGIRQLAPDGARAVIALRFRCQAAVPIDQTMLGTSAETAALRLFLNGDEGIPAALYQHLFNDVISVVYRNPDQPDRATVRQDWSAITRLHPWMGMVGYEPNEALLPYPPQAFPGYKILAEFVAYREKHFFVDLKGWAEARAEGVLASSTVEVLWFLGRDLAPALQRAVSTKSFLLGCTPAINLFSKVADVIPLTQRRYEYPVIPDCQHPEAYEVYSIEEVEHHDPVTGRRNQYDPFFSYQHGMEDRNKAFWSLRRRESTSKRKSDDVSLIGGTDVDLCFTDLAFEPNRPAEDQVLVTVLCTNRDLPNRFSGARLNEVVFVLPSFAGTVQAVRTPTPTQRPTIRREAYWRLISHLSLNHLSISGGSDGRQVIQEYMSLYDFSSNRDPNPIHRQFLEGILSVQSRPAVSFLTTATGLGYARGVEIDLELDEDKYPSVGTVFFSAMMERFLAMLTTVNSFTQVRLKTRQSGTAAIKSWPPRTGTRPLI